MGGKCDDDDDDDEEEEEVVVNSLCDNTRPLQDIINTSTFSLLDCSCSEDFQYFSLFSWQIESKNPRCLNEMVQSRI